MSEVFNSSIVIIRVYLMEKGDSNRTKIARYEDDVLPNIKKRSARESVYTNNWLVRYVTLFVFY